MTQDCQRLCIHRILTVALAAMVSFCVPFTSLAQDVSVTSDAGGLELTGRIVSFDGTFLQLDTAYGVMTLDYAGVTCVGTTCPNPETHVQTIRMSGAQRMGDVLMPALIEAFGRSVDQQTEISTDDADHLTVTLRDDDGVPKTSFELRLTSSDEGFADLTAFEADVVLALREVRPDEAERAKMVGLGDITDPRLARIIGFDALVPVVNPGLGLVAMSLQDVARAYRGDVSTWDELGGPDMPVALHLGPISGGPWQFFLDHVVLQNDGSLSERVTRHATAEALATAIATIPGSLGVVSRGEGPDSQPLALRDMCGFTAVAENITMKTQDYPLTQPLFLYLPDRMQPTVIEDFLAWLRGPEAQLVVRRSGFVDQGAVPISLDDQGQRFANAIAQAGEDITLVELQRMVRVLSPLTRLSTSFRFEVGSTRLDAASRSNLLALGQAIRNGRYDDQRLMLIGFGDGRGDAVANRDLSSARAEAVKRALIAAMGSLPEDVVVETEAFGEALPMGCDDTEWGRQRNRRVELWVEQR